MYTTPLYSPLAPCTLFTFTRPFDTHPLYSTRKPITDYNTAASIAMVPQLSYMYMYPDRFIGSTPYTHLFDTHRFFSIKKPMGDYNSAAFITIVPQLSYLARLKALPPCNHPLILTPCTPSGNL